MATRAISIDFIDIPPFLNSSFSLFILQKKAVVHGDRPICIISRRCRDELSLQTENVVVAQDETGCICIKVTVHIQDNYPSY